MTGTALWLAVIGMGAATYALRISFIVLLSRVEPPRVFREALGLVPAAVLAALVFPAFFRAGGTIDVSLANEHLLAGVLAAVVAWRTRNVLLMDVGLLWVPDEVLLTHPGKLNSLGRTRLEEHPKSGEGVLSAVPGLEEASRWVRWHHERPDGTGYPDRLRGGWIPLESKILAAASLYASLALDDPHTPALRPDEARRSLVGEIGGGVDEGVAKAFLRVLGAEGPAYAYASDRRFSFPSGHPGLPVAPDAARVSSREMPAGTSQGTAYE